MRPLLAFYGDDFTGSSAVLEVLTFAGVKAAMFLDVPTPALLAKLPDVRAIGIAGISRSQTPDWMDEHLPRYFRALAALGAPILHYKVCSTFDSSPSLGSIGRAIEIGQRETGSDWTPLVVGAPEIGRYQIFGTLFAAYGKEIFRLDRHPVMARHPATPMHEADLCRHLDAQTTLPKAMIDVRSLGTGGGGKALAAARAAGARIVAIDCLDPSTLAETGALIAGNSDRKPLFVAGSQGVEYALVAHWRRAGHLGDAPSPARFGPAEPLLVVSGSCSQTTARQIAAAEEAGFAVLPIDATQAVTPSLWTAEVEARAGAMLSLLDRGANVLVATARGPEDPAIPRLAEHLATSHADAPSVHARIGDGLGALLRRARAAAGIRRAIVAGGDTSGYAISALGAEALTPVAPLAGGVPLLRILSADPVVDGMEVALKGGQMGGEDLFIVAARGAG